jgi:hypothetical protein
MEVRSRRFSPAHVYRRHVRLTPPPPAAAFAAIAELRKARIKRQNYAHIFVCPRLITQEWLGQLYKEADLVFTIPLTAAFWSHELYEPLLVGICFPFVSSFPWQIKGYPKMPAFSRKVQKLWEKAGVDPGHFMCKLLKQIRSLVGVSERVVRQVLYVGERVGIPHGREPRELPGSTT